MSFQNQDQPDKRIALGRIASAHGVKGLVKILPYGENPALLEQVSDFKITLKNPMGKYYLAEIEGVSNRDEAEALKGVELFIARDGLPDPDDGEFYYEDLTGLKCVEENGAELGHIKAVLNFGAGELLEVRLKNGQDVLIPFTDEYVPDVDIEHNCVTILDIEKFEV